MITNFEAYIPSVAASAIVGKGQIRIASQHAQYQGCFQSSLLHAILGELEPISGSVSRRGRVAYTSQQPWVFSGSVRENILLGSKFEGERYWKTIHATALGKVIQEYLPRYSDLDVKNCT